MGIKDGGSWYITSLGKDGRIELNELLDRSGFRISEMDKSIEFNSDEALQLLNELERRIKINQQEEEKYQKDVDKIIPSLKVKLD